MSIDFDKIDKAIDYQVGDVIVPKHESIRPNLCLVTDISEKGIHVELVDYPGIDFKIPNHEMHLMKRHSTGSLLYGKKR